MQILILSANSEVLTPLLQQILNDDGVNDISFLSLSSLNLKQADLILMDHTLSEYEDLFFKVLEYKYKVVILISFEASNEINRIFYETGVNHLVELEEASSILELKNFILSWKAGHKLTFDDLSPAPLEITSAKINTSKNLDGQINTLLANHDFQDCFNAFQSYLTQILTETLTNALFNAPIDEAGNHLYRKKNRSEVVAMISGKEVEVKIASDQHKLVIKVKDFYGSLTENNLFDCLPVSQTRVRDCTGLGMYLIFKYAHKFIINVERDRSTEYLIIIEKDKRFKNYDLRGRSFHFYNKQVTKNEN